MDISIGDSVTTINALHLLLIIVSGIAAYLIFSFLMMSAVRRGLSIGRTRRHSPEETQKRAQTLTSVLRNVLGLTITCIVAFMLLAELGVNITPFLTGAGILGVAVGFGSQTLVKDVLSGLFILIEDQFDFGDVVTVAGLTGTVEELNLRRTVIRDEAGVEHHIPNSQITTVSNATKHSSAVSVDIPLAYSVDLGKAIALAQEVTAEVASAEEFHEIFLKNPEVIGVMHFTTDGLLLRIRGRCRPHTNATFERRLRQELQTRFRSAKIALGSSNTIIGS